MSVTVIPCGNRAPHTLDDFTFTRPCKACDGEGSERYISGEVLRDYRENIWGEDTMRRMAREIGVPASSLSQMERGVMDFTEDIARAYLVALGIL